VVFAHQSRWQQKMLLRYGCEVCVIDATHNTTAYGLPLFQLCVPTNCGYVTAATLLLTDEQANSIEEGLRKVAEWCPEWKPRCVLSDFCEAQIAAVEAVFPGNLYVYAVLDVWSQVLYVAAYRSDLPLCTLNTSYLSAE